MTFYRPESLAAATLMAMLSTALPAHAAIAPGASGNGELFLNVFDDVNQVSYAYDIGIRMDDFFKTGQPDGGTQFFRPLTDALFTAFLALATPAALKWSVMAVDSTGPNTPGSQRMFTTVRQGDEAQLLTWGNANFTNAISASQIGPFFDAVNSTVFAASGQSTHGIPSATNFAQNGTSWVTPNDALSSNAYYGKKLTPDFQRGAPFQASNTVGNSSWFYYVTRSGGIGANPVLIDEFDNGDGSHAGSGHDGYWGFTVVPASETGSPYAGQYLLSYTLEPRVYSFVAPTAQQREFAASIGRTEITGGAWVDRLAGMAAAGATEHSAGWMTVLGAAGNAGPLGAADSAGPLRDAGLPALLSPVPEPGAAWLLLVGGGLLWAGRCAVRGAKPALKPAMKLAVSR